MEHLILDYIHSDEVIKNLLATFNHSPAFFYQKAPNDKDRNWQGTHFPRADYSIEKTADPERNTAGNLLINLWFCNLEENSAHLDPETGDFLDVDSILEARLKTILSGTFFTENGITTCLNWRGSEGFSTRNSDKNTENHPVTTHGIAILFDLIEFHHQGLTDPDPIQGCNHFIKTLYPNSKVIGHDKLPPVWKPEENSEDLAFYWRNGGFSSSNTDSTYACSWYIGTIALHGFSPNLQDRNAALKTIAESIRTAGEIILLDSSPMFVKDITYVPSGDPLRQGQVKFQGKYGVLELRRKETAQPTLSKIIWGK